MEIDNKIIKSTVNFFEDISRSEIIIESILVGIISGLLVVLFKISINDLFNFIQNGIAPFSFSKKLLIFPLITTLGGLISGILVFKFAPETSGSGIPYVKLTLARIGKGTRIRSIIVKFLAGVAGIGTGLSLGREGPSVQLGAGAGAVVAKVFKKKGTTQHNLISAGAGSAIGATFNAPIAGTLFVLEELSQNFKASILFPVLIATVCASSIARYILGSNPSFSIPQITGHISFESLPLFIILGILAGVFGVLFAKIIFLNNKIYSKINIPNWAKPALAGFVVGIIGLFIPEILGSGNLSVNALLYGKFSIFAIALIFISKFLISPFCFGSGAAGGIFLPMLMLGSFLGYFVGKISVYFGIDVNPVILAMAGMGAFLSATARTPITALVMVFEMTGNYEHILPVMFSVAIADLVAEKLHHAPIYATLILKQGKPTKELRALSQIKIEKSTNKTIKKMFATRTLQQAKEVLEESSQDILPIINSKSEIVGSLSLNEIEVAILQGTSLDSEIAKIMNPEPKIIRKDEDLYKAFYIMHLTGINCMIVINNAKNVEGIITLDEILKHT